MKTCRFQTCARPLLALTLSLTAKWSMVCLLAGTAVGCGTSRHSAGSPSGPTAAPTSELLTFERTACFGQCPAYKVTLFDDGHLLYEGRMAVADGGPAELRISAPARAEIRSLIQRLSKLTSDCCNCFDWTDSPSVNISFRQPGRAELGKVDHYHGCEKAPDWLYDLENSIDEALGTERWVGRKIQYRAHHSIGQRE